MSVTKVTPQGVATGNYDINAATAYGLSVHTGRNNEANKVVRTDANGYLQTGYINSSNGDENNNSNPDRVWGTNGSDSYLRTYRTSALSVASAVNATNATNATTANNGAWAWGTFYAINDGPSLRKSYNLSSISYSLSWGGYPNQPSVLLTMTSPASGDYCIVTGATVTRNLGGFPTEYIVKVNNSQFRWFIGYNAVGYDFNEYATAAVFN